MTATCEELLLEVLLEHASDMYGSDTDSEHELNRRERGAQTETATATEKDAATERDTGTEEVTEDDLCVEIWELVSRLWWWFEDHELCAYSG